MRLNNSSSAQIGAHWSRKQAAAAGTGEATKKGAAA